MPHTREDVIQTVAALFPEADQGKILAILDEYGAQSYEPEADRVKLAIAVLSGGSEERLRHFLKMAKTDYRDVLAFVETGPLPPETGEKLRKAATEVLQKWGKR